MTTRVTKADLAARDNHIEQLELENVLLKDIISKLQCDMSEIVKIAASPRWNLR